MLADFRKAGGQCFNSVRPRVSGIVGQCLACVLAFGWVQENTVITQAYLPLPGCRTVLQPPTLLAAARQWDRAASMELRVSDNKEL